MNFYQTRYDNSQHCKPGFVYLILKVNLNIFLWKIKIGLSVDPDRRLRELKSEYGSGLYILNRRSTVNMYRLEQAAHKHFDYCHAPEPYPKSGHTEFFWFNPFRYLKMLWFLYFKEEQFKLGDRLISMPLFRFFLRKGLRF